MKTASTRGQRIGFVQSPPPKWKTAVLTWLAIYPTITGLLLLIGEPLANAAIPVRTLILTGVLVPLMTYVLMPAATRVLRRWLYVQAGEQRCTNRDHG